MSIDILKSAVLPSTCLSEKIDDTKKYDAFKATDDKINKSKLSKNVTIDIKKKYIYINLKLFVIPTNVRVYRFYLAETYEYISM